MASATASPVQSVPTTRLRHRPFQRYRSYRLVIVSRKEDKVEGKKAQQLVKREFSSNNETRIKEPPYFGKVLVVKCTSKPARRAVLLRREVISEIGDNLISYFMKPRSFKINSTRCTMKSYFTI
jgi:hypothetical protein